MTWFKVDDRFALHPKVEALEEFGHERHAFAVAAWVLLGSDCALRDDGGVVAPARLRKLLSAWPEKRRANAISDLVSVGLFDQTDGVIAFHDWDEYRRKDRGPEEKAEYERRKKAAQRVRAREKATDSGNVPGTSTGTVPVAAAETVSPSVPSLPTRPDPSRPDLDHSVVVSGRARESGPTQNTRPKSDRFCSALYASWKRSFGRVPGAGHPDRLDESWCVLGAGLTRLEATTLERCQAVASVMTVEQLDEAIQNFAADSFATKRGHPFELFAAQASRYVGKRPRHPSAVSDFSDAPENPEF